MEQKPKPKERNQRLLRVARQPMITKPLFDPPLSYAFCSTSPPPPPPLPPSASNSPPVLMGKAHDPYLSHLEQAKYMRKPYVLVSGITKNSLQLIDRRKKGTIKNLHICPLTPLTLRVFTSLKERKRKRAP